MKRCFIILLVILISVKCCFTQDPHFTQFYSNPLYLAPSFAGATEQHRLATTYRNQWPSMPGAFITYSFSYDYYSTNYNSGVGFLFMRDEAGTGRMSRTNAGIQYSYNIQISDLWYVRPGVYFLYTQRGLDFNRLLFNDQIHVSGTTSTIEVPSENSIGDIDFSTSALVFSNKCWLGISVDHLLRPNQSLYGDDIKLPIKYSVFGGVQIIRRSRLLRPIDETLSMAFIFRSQDYNNQLDVGLYYYKSPLVFGFWYRGIPVVKSNNRIGDAVALLVGFKIEQFSIGYSYDFTISKLLTSTGGAHEVSLIYEFTTYREKKKKHAIPCPEF